MQVYHYQHLTNYLITKKLTEQKTQQFTLTNNKTTNVTLTKKKEKD